MTDAVFIRASALPRYADCARRSAAALFRRQIEAAGYSLRRLPTGIAAAIGTSVHFSAKTVLEEVARSRLPPASFATDAALTGLTQELERDVEFDQTTPNRADAVRQAINMTRVWHRVTAPTIQPLAIERRFEANLGDGLVLTGAPDIVALEPGQIDDLKTGARLGNFNAQIGAYSLLARSAGLEITRGALDFIKRVRTNKPQPDPVRSVLPLAVAESAAANILRHIRQDLKTFLRGDEAFNLRAGDPASFMANPASNLCSAKYCPAHGTNFCHDWRVNE